MLHGILKIPVEGVHQTFVPCQGLEGDGIDEIDRIPRHKNMDVSMLFDQHAGQRGGLISRYASGHSQKNRFSCKHR